MFSECLWCHAVNDISFCDDALFTECLRGLSFDVNAEDIRCSLRAANAIAMLSANELLSRECIARNEDSFRAFYDRLWSQIDLIFDDLMRAESDDALIGSILRCDLSLDALSFNVGALAATKRRSLEKRFGGDVNSNAFRGSRTERIIVDALHSECRLNALWTDSVLKIQRNATTLSKSVEADILITLRGRHRRNVVVDVL